MPFYVKDALVNALVITFIFLAGLGIGGATTQERMEQICDCATKEGTD